MVTEKLRYSAEYLKSLILIKHQDTVEDINLIPLPGGNSNEVVNIADYHISGLIFARDKTDLSTFKLWKVLFKTPVGLTTVVDMFFVEVDTTTSNATSAVEWWAALTKIPITDDDCLHVQQWDTTSHGSTPTINAIIPAASAFDFAYFDAMSLVMQCQGADGVFISGAFTGIGTVYFREAAYNTADTLKSERVFTGAGTAGCIPDIAPSEEGLSDYRGNEHFNNAPNVLIGVPCPPFWGILGEMSSSEGAATRAAGNNNGPRTSTVVGLKGVSIRIAYAIIRFISALFGLSNHQNAALFKETIENYFRARLILNSADPAKHLADRNNNKIKTTYLGMERLRQILHNNEKVSHFFINSEQSPLEFKRGEKPTP